MLFFLPSPFYPTETLHEFLLEIEVLHTNHPIYFQWKLDPQITMDQFLKHMQMITY